MANRDFIYGRQPVREVLRAGKRHVKVLYIGASAKTTPDIEEIAALATESSVPVQRVKRHRLEQMADTHGNHQGVALEAGRHQYVEWRDASEAILSSTASHNPLFLFLDRIQDPQNLGSLLRSADAMGVDLVVIPKDRAAHVTPAVVRASAGASEHVAVCIVANLVNCQRQLQELDATIVGLEACPESVPLDSVEVNGPTALVVGSEGKGLRRLVKENCTTLASIPMHGRVNSLNAGVAGAVALYEISRSRET
ncbi:MAG: 23S rRNA (guanosine(2251)-2'-O)-methyltransferase RlmB [Kiritimatiellia bacterium]|jgi:23S rRNA (guanosine2251-2'-O)-methyltransferase|nr:23S rRNA (guanosine(2251)-2'-O)-methyltransferase RlmB [Kiritimatiellia bacterium]MDP6630865.1 23S rRNA (guanosine(2251)-2'-O)-methyltransferase RlmB [Kiritimatiellia bacterium]MDP6811133.1 23S rRNA (guanosine(2251)-2'-O)-methyltransferase RlmB [Kiritimatiellia bacterium]MDP7023406.1 23S rRNA (guanosine(2251)-2'-O)-methyltransferase RlmB [Kiritimatiellia bacterium]